MPDARPLVLALVLEAAPLGVVRLARPAWRRSAYVATLLAEKEPDTVDGPWKVLRDSPAQFPIRR